MLILGAAIILSLALVAVSNQNRNRSITSLRYGDRTDPETFSRKRFPNKKTFARIELAPLKQRTDMSCWATVYAMMKAWKDSRPWSVADAIQELGLPYTDYLARDVGLPAGHELAFVRRVGMFAEAPANYTLKGFIEMIIKHGPLWIIVGDGISSHAVLLTGVYGSSGAETITAYRDALFEFVDPRNGLFAYEPALEFMSRFEKEAGIVMSSGNSNLELRWQVLHW
jgi:hypothetical protein